MAIDRVRVAALKVLLMEMGGAARWTRRFARGWRAQLEGADGRRGRWRSSIGCVAILVPAVASVGTAIFIGWILVIAGAFLVAGAFMRALDRHASSCA